MNVSPTWCLPAARHISHHQGHTSPCEGTQGGLHSCQRYVALQRFAQVPLKYPIPIHTESTLGTPFQVHVSAAKAAVDALSAVLAVEEGPKGVRSNVIAPGPIGETEGWDRLSNKSVPGGGVHFPLGRVGHVKDIENATVFLFSDAASNITGQILPVDGAFTQVSGLSFPYPQAVLDTESVKHMIKPRL